MEVGVTVDVWLLVDNVWTCLLNSLCLPLYSERDRERERERESFAGGRRADGHAGRVRLAVDGEGLRDDLRPLHHDQLGSGSYGRLESRNQVLVVV